MKDWNITIGAA